VALKPLVYETLPDLMILELSLPGLLRPQSLMVAAWNLKLLSYSAAAEQRPAAAGELAQDKWSTHLSRDTAASN